jgi:O-acetyl-ADP-ribose deacetylase (regulator of RNase III)
VLTFTTGDMFETTATIRVNAVNCVGVMGAGIALAFKERYPEMFHWYQQACRAGEVVPGRLFVWRTLTEWILNVPTKRHWRDSSRYADVDAGLDALRDYLQAIGHQRDVPRNVTVAMPALGCGRGGLEWARVRPMIKAKLATLSADVIVFAPAAT